MEADAAVVDALQAHLVAAVLDLDPLEDVAVGVADRDDERVHSLGLARDVELGEHGGHPAVPGGVADPVLARVLVGRVDDELLRGGVIARLRADAADVGAVTALAHGEAAGQVD